MTVNINEDISRTVSMSMYMRTLGEYQVYYKSMQSKHGIDFLGHFRRTGVQLLSPGEVAKGLHFVRKLRELEEALGLTVQYVAEILKANNYRHPSYN